MSNWFNLGPLCRRLCFDNLQANETMYNSNYCGVDLIAIGIYVLIWINNSAKIAGAKIASYLL